MLYNNPGAFSERNVSASYEGFFSTPTPFNLHLHR
jgi:hypothetical protein